MNNPRTLLIDSEWNLKRNFMKRENLFAKGEHCGGSFGFLDSLRSVVNKTMPDSVVAMWDGVLGGKLRHDIYPLYKSNRDKSWDELSYSFDEHLLEEEKRKKYSKLQQKVKVRNYLEDLSVRQVEVDYIEADDLIALYVNSKNPEEEIIIFSSDKDYIQLISEKVIVLKPDNSRITVENFKELFGFTHKNALILRCFEGDVSDCISGVDGIGKKTILKHFPKFAEEEYDIDRFIKEAVELYNKKKSKTLEKIIGSRRIIERNHTLMSLKEPMVNEEAIEAVSEIRDCVIVADGEYSQRNMSSVTTKIFSDGYNKLIWEENVEFFLRPFYRLISKEKEYTEKILKG